jgi:RimJ/RimL family protein N-acetyltransferase
MDDRSASPGRIRLRPWAEPDLGLLVALNTPEMTEHLGGPETDEQVRRRLDRYVNGSIHEDGEMFVIESTDGVAMGGIGFWPRHWTDGDIYETGWGVLPGYQGKGVASMAARFVIGLAAAAGQAPALHAFPAVSHPASNAVCRKAGFVLIGPADFEYPPGRPMRVNDWRFDLSQAATNSL